MIDERPMDLGGVVIYLHFDSTTNLTWKWVDTDGDNKPDVRRMYDKDGNLVEDQVLPDPITGAGFDNKTGVTTEQVDTDHDGKPDLERKYDREGRKTGEQPIDPGSPGSKSTDPLTGITSEWVDLDGDGINDIVRKRAKDGTVIDEFPLDGGHIIIDYVIDSDTGTETKYVDTNGDGIPDAARMYDKFGNKLTDRIIRGKLIKRDLNEHTGELTEWIDMDGDGRPDVSRKFNEKGLQIEEKPVDPKDLGNAVGMSLEQSTGNSPFMWMRTKTRNRIRSLYAVLPGFSFLKQFSFLLHLLPGYQIYLNDVYLLEN